MNNENITKYRKNYDLNLIPFTKCNLNCDFCFQLHGEFENDEIDTVINDIKKISMVLKESYTEDLKSADQLTIDIAGGELFADNIPDILFDAYRDLCTDVISIIRSHNTNTEIEFVFVSNGVYTKHDRVIKFLNDVSNKGASIFLKLSYDSVGRFKTKEQFEMFKNTFWYFYNHKILSSVAFGMTKRSMNAIMNNQDIFINTIPKDINIETWYFMCGDFNKDDWNSDQPTNDDLFNFFKWALDNNKFQYNKIKYLLTIDDIKDSTYYPHISDIFVILYENKFVPDIHPYLKPPIPNVNDLLKEDCPPYTINTECIYCKYNSPICSNRQYEFIPFPEYRDKNCFLRRIIEYLYNHPEIKHRYEETLIDEKSMFYIS